MAITPPAQQPAGSYGRSCSPEDDYSYSESPSRASRHSRQGHGGSDLPQEGIEISDSPSRASRRRRADMPQEGLEIVPAAAPEARASAPKAPAGRVRRKESSPDVEEEPGRKKQVRKRRKHKHRSHHEARAESASPAQEAGSPLPSTGRLERDGEVVKRRYPVGAAVARLDNLESRMQQAESDLDYTMSTVAKHRNQQLFQLMNDVTAARSKAATECVISGFPTEGTNVEARCAMVQWMCEEAGISNTRMELISQSHCGEQKRPQPDRHHQNG